MPTINIHCRKCCGAYNQGPSHRTSNGWVTTSVNYVTYDFTTDSPNIVLSHDEIRILNAFLEPLKDEKDYDSDMPEWHEEEVIAIESLVKDLNSCQSLNVYVESPKTLDYSIKEVLRKNESEIAILRGIVWRLNEKKKKEILEIHKDYCNTLLKNIDGTLVELLNKRQIPDNTVIPKTSLFPADVLLYNNNFKEFIELIIRSKVKYEDLSCYIKVRTDNRIYSAITMSNVCSYLDILNCSIPGYNAEESQLIKQLIRDIEIRDRGYLSNVAKNIASLAFDTGGAEAYEEIIRRSEFFRNNKNALEGIITLGYVLEKEYLDARIWNLTCMLDDSRKLDIAEVRLLKRLVQEPEIIDDYVEFWSQFEDSSRLPSSASIIEKIDKRISDFENAPDVEKQNYLETLSRFID